jgi:LacI family gluconate utilization system Gnt-I transcriptional repressor
MTERVSPIKMEHVANAAGVSLMTVSNSFQQPNKVRPETRERVFAAATELGYVPNAIASNLASGRSRVIGAIVPSLRNANFAGMMQGLIDHLEAQNYQLLVANADTHERQMKSLRAFLGRRVDGLVLTGTEHPPELRLMLEMAGVPVVEALNLDGPVMDMAVGFSNYDAARALTERIIERGFKRIGFAGYEPRQSRFRERQRAFQDALADAGLRNDLLFFGPESLGYAGGRVAMNHLLEIEPNLQVMFCVTDIFAVGALFESMRRGWSVPERFAVTGFGDFEIAAEVPPGLTTVGLHSYSVGRAAADMLIGRATGQTVENPIRDVGYEIIMRGSL